MFHSVFFVQNNDNYTKNDQHDKKWIENNLLIYFNNWQLKILYNKSIVQNKSHNRICLMRTN